jgi:hypothetical protein
LTPGTVAGDKPGVFVGHYGAAFLAKRVQPRAPFWALLLAVMWVDVLWAVFVLTGLERARLDASLTGFPVVLEHMPLTHSLVATGVWAAFGWVVARHGFGWPSGVAAAIAAAVASHWFHDLPVHRPDLPLLWGEPKLGLGLWNYPMPELALEIGWLLATVALLVRSDAVDAASRTRIWRFAAGLVVLQVVTAFGPVPPGITPLAVTALLTFLAVPWLGSRVAA